jgi:hypothetical protein
MEIPSWRAGRATAAGRQWPLAVLPDQLGRTMPVLGGLDQLARSGTQDSMTGLEPDGTAVDGFSRGTSRC